LLTAFLLAAHLLPAFCVCCSILAAGPNHVRADDALISTTEDSNSAVRVCRIESGAAQSTRLFSVSSVGKLHSVTVSPDGQRLAFCLAAEASATAKTAVVVTDINGRNAVQIGFGHQVSWSPGGHRLVVTTAADHPDAGVWLVRADGTDPQIVDSRGTISCWSADGNRIAYIRTTDRQHRIILRNIVEDDTSLLDCPLLKDGDVQPQQLFWSPDNRHLFMVVRTRSGHQLVSIPVRHPAQQTITALDGVLSPHQFCSSGSTSVLFTGNTPDGNFSQLLITRRSSDGSFSTPQILPQQFSQRNNFSASATSTADIVYLSAPR
jgi:Tol biopolymer transport system component